tara:strand:+ start:169 stop:1284 length:1116 start_codon:yes stop_codon:yes gene_type:complete
MFRHAASGHFAGIVEELNEEAERTCLDVDEPGTPEVVGTVSAAVAAMEIDETPVSTEEEEEEEKEMDEKPVSTEDEEEEDKEEADEKLEDQPSGDEPMDEDTDELSRKKSPGEGQTLDELMAESVKQEGPSAAEDEPSGMKTPPIKREGPSDEEHLMALIGEMAPVKPTKGKQTRTTGQVTFMTLAQTEAQETGQTNPKAVIGVFANHNYNSTITYHTVIKKTFHIQADALVIKLEGHNEVPLERKGAHIFKVEFLTVRDDGVHDTIVAFGASRVFWCFGGDQAELGFIVRRRATPARRGCRSSASTALLASSPCPHGAKSPARATRGTRSWHRSSAADSRSSTSFGRHSRSWTSRFASSCLRTRACFSVT